MVSPATPSRTRTEPDRVFAALLKYWRGARGLSQLDLAVAAEVSSRHVSFLETARSQPSVEMVLLLAETLDIPLRDRNELLRAAGFAAHYAEPRLDEALTGVLGTALATMLEHHEPYPLLVIDRLYGIVQTNRAGGRLLAVAGIDVDQPNLNLLKVLFDPAIQAQLDNWPEAASGALRRLQRELFHRPQDEAMQTLLGELLSSPGVPDSWRQPDPAAPSEPVITLKARLGGQALNFLTTMTTFNAPLNVTLDELRIESWYPLDDVTARLCAEVLGGPDPG